MCCARLSTCSMMFVHMRMTVCVATSGSKSGASASVELSPASSFVITLQIHGFELIEAPGCTVGSLVSALPCNQSSQRRSIRVLQDRWHGGCHIMVIVDARTQPSDPCSATLAGGVGQQSCLLAGGPGNQVCCDNCIANEVTSDSDHEHFRLLVNPSQLSCLSANHGSACNVV